MTGKILTKRKHSTPVRTRSPLARSIVLLLVTNAHVYLLVRNRCHFQALGRAKLSGNMNVINKALAAESTFPRF